MTNVEDRVVESRGLALQAATAGGMAKSEAQIIALAIVYFADVLKSKWFGS